MSRAPTVTKLRIRPVSSEYMELVRRFPLRPLRSERERAAAGAILDGLVGRDGLSEGEREYGAALAYFVADFERGRVRILRRSLSPLQLLRHLLEENGLNTADLGRILGSRGVASEVLAGKRALSKAMIGKLAERFGVDGGLFLDRGARAA
jgi:HTH-type transcriptional regulator/antitoxin HigA